MTWDEPKQIRSLDRGLWVVETLASRGPSALADLRRATGLPNATLLRLLATLQARGWVRRNIVEGQYELTYTQSERLHRSAHAHPMAELAAPFLLKMKTRAMGIPCDLCTIVGPGKIEVIESTRVRGPLAPQRTGLGVRPSMLFSSHGRAILAFSPKAELEAHFAAIRRTASKRERAWLESGQFDAELRETAKRGYGIRQDDYWVFSGFDPGPELAAIAVPIVSATGLYGSLSLLWLRESMKLETVIQRGGLEDLKDTAGQIGAALDAAGHVAPGISNRPRFTEEHDRQR